MKFKKFQRVEMKPRFAAWHINHSEVYGDFSTEEITNYDVEIQLFLMCLMGIPIRGLVLRQGIDQDTFGVIFSLAGLTMDTYVNTEDLKWLK
jgi:hypothetical protein